MKYYYTIIFTALFSLYFFTGLSCKSNKSQLPEDTFYYFPEKNIYYDINRSNYYYSLDSAKSWDSLAFDGKDFGSALGTKIPVSRPDNVPWAKNDSHRRAYKGVLINLVNSQTLLLAKEDSLRRMPPVAVTKPRPLEVKEIAEEAPKKGLKRFFNRLFGKKKPKKESE